MLTGKKALALEHLLTSNSYKQAADRAGISLATLARYRQDEEFKSEYEARRRENIESISNLIGQSAHKAVWTMNEVMMDKKAPAMARVTAASKVLDIAYQNRDRDDVAQKMEALREEMAMFLEERNNE